MPTHTVASVVRAMDARYDPRWAQDWDAVGLVAGDPGATVTRVLLAVDPVDAVVDEAASLGAQLVVTHHPLLLRGVHSVATTTAKGRTLDRLARAGIGLHVAHTNADVARPGVSDALARALGVEPGAPLDTEPPLDAYKLVTFVPHDAVDAVLDALSAAGAGRIGDYERCAFLSEGTGTFVATGDAEPVAGSKEGVSRVPETRVETVLPRPALADVLAALRSAHPYEEPAFDVLATVIVGDRGLGRVGELAQPTTLAEFGLQVAGALRTAPGGIRVAGEADRPIRRVAVCGGAGDDLVAAALREGADVFVTADLRHHVVSEALADGLALVDAGHWTTERPWLDVLAAELRADLATVDVVVSEVVTDPWSLTCHRRPEGDPAA